MTLSAISAERLAGIVQAGNRAPSGDNCQPWSFCWDGRVLSITFVPERAESFYDVQSVASWISLGAVLTNMALAARQGGLRTCVELFPGHDDPHVVARVAFEAAAPESDPLVEAIARRCVNRRPYRSDRLPGAFHDELMAIAGTRPGVRLSWVDSEPLKARVAAVAAQNDRVLFEHRALHEGLFRWIRWSRAEAERLGDGMPVETLELSPFERPGIRLLGSWRCARLAHALGISKALPSRARAIYRRSGAIALLTVTGRAPADFVRGGEVLERIWLTATLRNVAFQPITGLTFLVLRLTLAAGEGFTPAHRDLVEHLEGELGAVFPAAAAESPIMLFRLGLADPPSARAPRRPLEQILLQGTSGP
jgi:hypothetical protein